MDPPRRRTIVIRPRGVTGGNGTSEDCPSCAVLLRLRRDMAVRKLQAFYRIFVHCERDENGCPRDPIMLEGIPRERLLTICYQTYCPGGSDDGGIGVGDGERVRRMTRVLRFDVQTLWSSLVYGPAQRPVNPLTGTAFTEEQFDHIARMALRLGIAQEAAVGEMRGRYQMSFHSMHTSSRYEVNDANQLRLERGQRYQRIIRLVLAGETVAVLDLLALHQREILEGRWNLNQRVVNRLGRFPYLKEFDVLQLACALGRLEVFVRLLELGVLMRRLPVDEVDSDDSDEEEPALEGYVHPVHIALYESQHALLPVVLVYETACDPLLLTNAEDLTAIEVIQMLGETDLLENVDGLFSQ